MDRNAWIARQPASARDASTTFLSACSTAGSQPGFAWNLVKMCRGMSNATVSRVVFNSNLNTLGPITVTLSYLQADGLLNVTLTKGGGAGSSFSFVRSTLFADGVVGDPGNDVPEPVTLALLGIGLLGGVARLRRSRRA